MSEPEAEPERPEADEQPVPKLPRGPMFSRVAVYDLFRIAMFACLLVVVLFMGKPCAKAVSNYFDVLAPPAADAGALGEEDGGQDEIRYERLTPEQIRERFGGDESEAPDAGAAGDAGVTGRDGVDASQ